MPGGPPRPRSIHNVLTPVAVLVIVGGMILSREVRGLVTGLMVFGTALAALISTGRLVANFVVGLRCPGCGQPRLARREVQTFGDRFFECVDCGARMVRTSFGSWRDASGPECAHHFDGGIALDPWTRTGVIVPETEGKSEPEPDPTSTHATLLRRKRQRTPESPNGPGLVP